jgi:hypothetical protein
MRQHGYQGTIQFLRGTWTGRWFEAAFLQAHGIGNLGPSRKIEAPSSYPRPFRRNGLQTLTFSDCSLAGVHAVSYNGCSVPRAQHRKG